MQPDPPHDRSYLPREGGAPAPDTVLSERAQHLFRVLVQRYIGSGQPVGSRILSRDSGLDLSPATVRNVMADLEEIGLLSSPHVSAGRVPTVQGYRFFVDSLLQIAPIDGHELDRLRSQLETKGEREPLVNAATALISEITHMAGVVTLPKQERLILRHVEFIALSPERVLVILVVNGSDVQNRIIHPGRPYSQAVLQQVGNYLNEVCAGKDLLQVRESLLAELREHRSRLDALMLTAIEMADKAFVRDPGGDEALLVSGETNLMEYGELANLEKLRHLFEAFHEKTKLLHILDQCLRADGLQIFIGEESGFEVLDGCSVITTPYEREGEVLGVLGVIGPTRMAYERVIPIVDVTARLLGAALNQHH